MKKGFVLLIALMIALAVVSYADEETGFHTVEIVGYRFSVPDDCTFQSGDSNGGIFVGDSLNGPLFFMVVHDIKEMLDVLPFDRLCGEALSATGAAIEKSENTSINGLQAVRWSGTHAIKEDVYQASGFVFVNEDEIVMLLLDNMSGGSRDDDENILSVIINSIQFPSQPVQATTVNYDLSTMSFDELLVLKEQVNLALWASDKWQEVTVPAGVYEIGRDIPAGHWTITPVDGETARVYWGSSLDESKTDIPLLSLYTYEQITSPEDTYAKYNNIESVSWDLTGGSFVVIKDSAVVFSPFAGLDLGFK